VIKVGGGLNRVPDGLDRVCRALGQAADGRRVVVVPGGGPFADAVREFDRQVGLSADAAHWMAVLAMDQYAYVLAERIPRGMLVDELGAVGKTLNAGHVAVLAPGRWLKAADLLPHTWEVTSDSIAAVIAGALDAGRLILIKPKTDLPEPVDRHFLAALPAGLPYWIVGCDRLEELSQRFTD
jgi:aspartokinase-like uncharacterized kinase